MIRLEFSSVKITKSALREGEYEHKRPIGSKNSIHIVNAVFT